MRGARRAVAALLAMTIATSVLAEAPATSPRPLPRPVLSSAQTALVPLAEPPAVAPMSMRPKLRPTDLAAVPAAAVPAGASPRLAGERSGLFGFLRPSRRPTERPDQPTAALRNRTGKGAAVSAKGAACGIADIKGETLAPITSKVKGCGIAEPVRITSVAGVRLSTPATINCETATALRNWILTALEPAYGGGKVVELRVAATYACRPRNGKSGAKISEHGRGNAIDIAGLTFSDGKSVSVLKDYNATMRKAHKAACGIFGTTLGPGSDGFHEDHLHFDIARYRGGPYCR